MTFYSLGSLRVPWAQPTNDSEDDEFGWLVEDAETGEVGILLDPDEEGIETLYCLDSAGEREGTDNEDAWFIRRRFRGRRIAQARRTKGAGKGRRSRKGRRQLPKNDRRRRQTRGVQKKFQQYHKKIRTRYHHRRKRRTFWTLDDDGLEESFCSIYGPGVLDK